MNTTDESRPATGAGNGESPRRLTRSKDDKVLTGLAGGLGRYMGIDPVVFRIAFVVLSFVGGTGILLYLAGSALVPDDTGTSEADRLLNPRNRKIALWVLAIVGVGLFLDGFDDNFGGVPVGLVLVAVGFSVLWSRRNGPTDGGGSPTTPPSATPTDSGTATSPHVSLAEGTEEVAPDAPPPSAASAVAAPPKPRSILVPVTLSLLAITAGVLALFGVSVDIGIAIALLVVGLALVVGAWRGRARALIPIALLLSVGLCAASVVDVPLRGGAGERTFTPTMVSEVVRPYRLAAGEMTLNLHVLDLRSGSRTVEASVGFGKLTVIVPRDAEVDVRARAGLGQVTVGGQRWDGTDVDRRVVLAGSEGGGGGRLVVRAEVGMGEVEVVRAVA